MRIFTRRHAVGAALAAALAVQTPVTAPAAAQATNLTAVPDRAAAIPVPASRAANAVLLDFYVRAFRPPRRGAVEAIVSLGPTGSEMEIGRFAVFPSEPFLADNPKEQRAYRFDASAALGAYRGQPLVAQIRLVPTDDKISPEGAQLTLSRVEINPRPAPDK
jgi:hypothetical protein